MTSGALSLLAFMAADLSHEVLGHGSVALLDHAKLITLSYTALSTDISSRTLALAGPAVNLVLGAAGFALFRRIPPRRLSPGIAWLLFLFASMSLMNLSAYLILSGATATGDLAVAFAGLPHPAIIRGSMAIIGLVAYFALVRILTQSFRRFAAPNAGLSAAAWLAPLLLNTAAALLSPLGHPSLVRRRSAISTHRWAIRHGDVFVHVSNSLVAHSVDLSLWHDVQAFGIWYLSDIAGAMNLKVCELTNDPGTPSAAIFGMWQATH